MPPRPRTDRYCRTRAAHRQILLYTKLSKKITRFTTKYYAQETERRWAVIRGTIPPRTRAEWRISSQSYPISDVKWTIYGQQKGRQMVLEARRILRDQGTRAQFDFLTESIARLKRELAFPQRESSAHVVHDTLVPLLEANPHYGEEDEDE